MNETVRAYKDKSIPEILEAMKSEALCIHQEDMDMCRAISEYGLTLIKDGDGILTHCNAGPLATSRYGTGLGTLFLAKERVWNFTHSVMRRVRFCRVPA